MKLEDIDKNNIIGVRDLGGGDTLVQVKAQAAGVPLELMKRAREELQRIHEQRDSIALAHLIAAGIDIYRHSLFLTAVVMGRNDPVRVHSVAMDMHAVHQQFALTEIQREIEEFFASKARGEAAT